ncbi:hypothetical protein N480_03305 [Pseudoalteromonas luteoviolacea S2607]|nr:hypothetical protein N480_03305 [Pseudoalteromonas luteoviolacea S2607]
MLDISAAPIGLELIIKIDKTNGDKLLHKVNILKA